MFTAVLVYNLNVGIQDTNSVRLRARAAAIDLNYQDTFTYLGVDLVGDQTDVVDGLIKRTLTFQTNAFAELYLLYQTPEQLANATRNLFQDIFALQMPALVTAEEPVVS